MIVSRLCGGLGNQMFQYALGRRLALDRNVPLKLDVSALTRDPLRHFALDGFRIDATVATVAELAILLPWPRRLPRRLAWLPRWPGRARLIRERGFAFDPGVLDASDSVCLEGYWQTERYFKDVADHIRRDFQLVRPMTANRVAIAKTIQQTAAISVHVRRGDYITNPVTNAYHGTCAPEWYEKAMSLMAEAVEGPTFFVFSDDPAWVQANLPARWPIHLVEPQRDGRDCEDMLLMASCRHHIIANSSFSWWGAWLNPSTDKRVIAPARWFIQTASDTRDLLPHSWLRL